VKKAGEELKDITKGVSRRKGDALIRRSILRGKEVKMGRGDWVSGTLGRKSVLEG